MPASAPHPDARRSSHTARSNWRGRRLVALIASAVGLALAPIGAAQAAGGYTSVTAGAHHTCALRADATVACWGGNYWGPATAPAGAFRSVSAGDSHTCAVRDDETLACWGFNGYGQTNAPTGAFRSVSAGAVHTCAVKTDATLACWGHGLSGEATVPAGAFTSVSAGGSHTCAVKTDETLACWGHDADGRTNVPAGTFRAVSAGAAHTCAVKADAALACWGYNFSGQANAPAGAFRSVSAGRDHTCALRLDDTIACWGRNSAGQADPPPGAFASVGAGDHHSCAVRLDGGLACWGNNASGQTDVPAPNSAPSPPGAPALGAGFSTPNQGTFDLAWSASTDADSDPISYRVEHRDANDSSYTPVAGADSLSDSALSFSSGSPEAEGTWTYRVRASDGSLDSAVSAASPAVKVDTSKPHPPTLVLAAGQSPVTVAGVDWHADSVIVDIHDHGDPSLQDASDGSGVDAASLRSPFAVSANGTSTLAKTVKDEAGNESDTGKITVNVDAADPTVSITGCPAAPVTVASLQSVTVVAADGESGLADDPSGVVSLQTNGIGLKTTRVTATDRVGHDTTAHCSYSVIYDWSGFFQPIDNTDATGHYVLNGVKAGTAVPVKFSLDGPPAPGSNADQGENVLAAGSPTSGQIACSATASADEVEETLSAGHSRLSYDASADQYVYIWKTDKLWAGTCRQLVVTLADGTEHRASFQLTK